MCGSILGYRPTVPRTNEKIARQTGQRGVGRMRISYGHFFFPTGLSDKLINILRRSQDLFVKKKNENIMYKRIIFLNENLQARRVGAGEQSAQVPNNAHCVTLIYYTDIIIFITVWVLHRRGGLYKL